MSEKPPIGQLIFELAVRRLQRKALKRPVARGDAAVELLVQALTDKNIAVIYPEFTLFPGQAGTTAPGREG